MKLIRANTLPRYKIHDEGNTDQSDVPSLRLGRTVGGREMFI